MKWSRDLWKREKMIDRGNGKMTTDSRLSTAEPPVKRETEVSSEGLDRGGGGGGGRGEHDRGRGDHTEGDRWGGGRGRGGEDAQGRRRIRGRYNKRRGEVKKSTAEGRATQLLPRTHGCERKGGGGCWWEGDGGAEGKE